MKRSVFAETMSVLQSSSVDQDEDGFRPRTQSVRVRPKVISRAGADGGVLMVLYVIVFAVVAFLALIPLAALVVGSLRDTSPGVPGQWTLANLANLLSRW